MPRNRLKPLASLLAVALAPIALAQPPGSPRDSDGDGIPDHVEEATGTSPFDADTDGDGVPDGVEDANQDGVLDPGESNPRRAGLFPGTNPHIPEPMHFDLVRGLGARKGELEVNVLMALSRPTGRPYTVDWAPEVEWAPVDGFAVEIEVPMNDREVVALKSAVQWTAPSIAPSIAHGVQVIGEYLLDEAITEVSGLYLFGGRSGPVSLFTMLGARAGIGEHLHVVGLLNPSLFVDLDEAVTLGLEGNLMLEKERRTSALLLAQVHWQVSRSFRVQAGGGASIMAGEVLPTVVARLILE